MRLTNEQVRAIRLVVHDIGGPNSRVRVFGSPLNHKANGGDLDLLTELPDAVENPAVLAAGLSARISRCLCGRKVDVLLLAPNLRRLPIHEIALNEGQPL